MKTIKNWKELLLVIICELTAILFILGGIYLMSMQGIGTKVTGIGLFFVGALAIVAILFWRPKSAGVEQKELLVEPEAD